MTVPLFNLTDTWNASGTVFTAIQMNVANTASAAGSKLLDLQIGGVSTFNVDKTGYWTLGAGDGATAPDTFAFRDAANILAHRNGTNAQTLRVYNTFTDASNYERGIFDWTTTANTLTIGPQAAGTGTLRNVTGLGVWSWSAVTIDSAGGGSGGGLSLLGGAQIRGGSLTFGSADQGMGRAAAGVTEFNSGILGGGHGATICFRNNTPATLASGSTNNYSLSTANSYFQRLTANAANSTLTGLVYGQFNNQLDDGALYLIINVAASGTLTLSHQDAGSTAANRFLCSTGASIVLSPNQAADLIYDTTVSRWLVFKRN